jgi:SAM-dependent methyltransferase
MSDHRPTERFSTRADDYRRFRPGYPAALIDAILAAAPTAGDAAPAVADLGSGTGISAEPFLRRGFVVYGVEPNAAMRAAGEDALSAWPAFHSLAATAEETGLPSESVQIITAGQALHWFRLADVRREVARIAAPGAVLAIFWNTRDGAASPFMQGYEALVERHATDFRSVFHGKVREEEIAAFFAESATGPVVEQRFPWCEALSLKSLRGRTLSSSYLPNSGPAGDAMLADLHALFESYEEDSVVTMAYTAGLWLGAAPRQAASRASHSF